MRVVNHGEIFSVKATAIISFCVLFLALIFFVDAAAPAISDSSPSGSLPSGTTQTTLSVTTDVEATCKYGTSSGFNFSRGTAFSTTGGTSHSTSIGGLTDGSSYTYYVKCQNTATSEISIGYSISFSVASAGGGGGGGGDTTAPTVTISSPIAGTIASGTAMTLAADASDNSGTVSGVQFQIDGVNLGPEVLAAPFITVWDTTGFAEGAHTLTAIARDPSGNTTVSAGVAVTVQNGPTLSNGAPFGIIPSGTQSTTISLITDKDATCKYATVPDVAYASMSNTFTTTGGVNHSTVVAGLSDGITFTYYIRCKSGTFASGSDYTISFSVATPTQDITVPSQPTGLTTTSQSTQVALVWNAATDNNAVVGYKVYRNGTYATTTNSFSFLDTGLLVNTSYTYEVSAIDAANNESIKSLSASATTLPADTGPVRSAGGPSGLYASNPNSAPKLVVTTNIAAICKYSVSPGVGFSAMESTFATTGGTSHTSGPLSVTAGKKSTYYVKCQGVSANTNTDDYVISFSNAVLFTGIQASPTQINLAWGGFVSDKLAGYRIVKNGAVLVSKTSATQFVDTSVSPTARYVYQLFGVDFAGNPIDISSIPVTLTMPSYNPIAGCANAVDYTDVVYGGKVRQLNKPDGHEHHFYYHRNATNADNSYMVLIREDLTQKQSWISSLYTGDGCYIKDLFTSSQYNWRIAWDRSNPNIFYTTQGSSIYKYDVISNQATLLKTLGVFISVVTGPSLNQAGDRILVVTTDKAFRSFRLSDMSDEKVFTAVYATGCKTDLEDERYTGYLNQIATGCASDDLTVKHLYFYDDTGTLISDINGIDHGHKDYSPDGKLAYYVMPSKGQQMVEIGVMNVDGTGKIPYYTKQASGLIRNVHLSWPDKVSGWFLVGFFPYQTNTNPLPSYAQPPSEPFSEILKCTIATQTCAPLVRSETMPITAAWANFWAESMPSPSADGSRVVFISNAAGTDDVHILYPNGAPPISMDSQPPTVPVIQSVTSDSDKQITVAWSAATDNVGVAGYRLYRNGAFTATPLGTSYIDAGLAANTSYSYQISAFDGAGNESAKSSAVSGTTLTPAACSTNTILQYNDASYGSKINQLSKTDGNEHNIYFHRNPFNADMSRMVGVQSDVNDNNWQVVLYNGDGCLQKTLFPISSYDWRLVWDRKDANILYTYLNSGSAANLYRYNVTTGTTTLLKTFTGATIKGNGLSLNQVGDRIFVLTSDLVYRSYRLPDMSLERTFTVSFPAGCNQNFTDERYIGYQNYIVTHCASSDFSVGIMRIYDDTGILFHEFNSPALSGGHYDFSPNGKLAYKNYQTGSALEIHLVNIDGSNPQIITLPASKVSYIRNLHLSWPDAVNDWFVVSLFPFDSVPAAYTPFVDEIIKIYVNGTFQYLARSGTKVPLGAFWPQALASPSADGSRISFNSNKSGTIDQFILYMNTANTVVQPWSNFAAAGGGVTNTGGGGTSVVGGTVVSGGGGGGFGGSFVDSLIIPVVSKFSAVGSTTPPNSTVELFFGSPGSSLIATGTPAVQSGVLGSASSTPLYVTLSWENPTTTNWTNTVIVKKDYIAPGSPFDGIIIYSGKGNSVVDATLTASSSVFYRAFTLNYLQDYIPGPTVHILTTESNTIAVGSAEIVLPAVLKEGISIPTVRLALGATGSNVVLLQEILRREGFFTHATSTGFFGPITKNALIAFQKKYDIPATGFFGGLTLAKIKMLYGSPAAEILPAASVSFATTTPATSLVSRTLRRGFSGADVRSLQEFMVKLGFFPADYKRTEFFGKMTEDAVKAFQLKYGIEPTGLVGPETIKRIEELRLL